MTQELIFLGLLLGIKDILQMLFRALDAGFQSGTFHKDLIACTCRAVIELHALGLPPPPMRGPKGTFMPLFPVVRGVVSDALTFWSNKARQVATPQRRQTSVPSKGLQ